MFLCGKVGSCCIVIPMPAKILKPSEDAIRECIKALDEGQMIIYPTETVYGLGVNPTNEKARQNLFKIKRRDPSKPISIAVESIERAGEFADIDQNAQVLAKRFLPGPLTLVLKPKKDIPGIAQNGRIGIRIPSNQFALKLLKAYGRPITATSANISGAGSVSDPQRIDKQLLNRVAIFVDAGVTEQGKESTVIELIDKSAKMLREGAIRREEIESVLKVKIE